MKLLLIMLFSSTFSLFAANADRHAPIGVMADHTHGKGDYMLSLRQMSMRMKTLIDGTSEKSDSEYDDDTTAMMVPDFMNMKMTMLGFMYGVSENYTLAIMQGYVQNEMEMSSLMMSSNIMETQTEGLSDTKIRVLRDFAEDEDLFVVASLGLSLPTGKIDEKYNKKDLGYPMQLGSGSYGALYSLTVTKFMEGCSYGGQLSGVSYLNENSKDYKLGSELAASLWGSYSIIDQLSFSLRYEIKNYEKISGENEDQNKMMSTLSMEEFSKRQFQNAYLGANYIFKNGHRLAAEYGKLMAFDVNDYQLAPDESFTLGWQKAF